MNCTLPTTHLGPVVTKANILRASNLLQVDVRLNEIELQLGADSESEELSLEEEERNQESFI